MTLPLVLVHGLAGDRNHWTAQVEHLAARRRVVAVDLRGHGGSLRAPDGDYRLDAFARDVEELLDTLRIDGVVLVGHSFGAAVIGALAARCPDRVRGLVFVDPTGDLSRLPRDQVERWLEPLRGQRYRRFVEAQYQRLLAGASEDVRQRVLASLAATPPEVVLGALESVRDYDPLPAFRRCRAPRLAIVNPELHRGPESLHRAVPDLPHREMPGTSHWLMMDRPEEFDGLLDAFLDGLDP